MVVGSRSLPSGGISTGRTRNVAAHARYIAIGAYYPDGVRPAQNVKAMPIVMRAAQDTPNRSPSKRFWPVVAQPTGAEDRPAFLPSRLNPHPKTRIRDLRPVRSFNRLRGSRLRGLVCRPSPSGSLWAEWTVSKMTSFGTLSLKSQYPRYQRCTSNVSYARPHDCDDGSCVSVRCLWR